MGVVRKKEVQFRLKGRQDVESREKEGGMENYEETSGSKGGTRSLPIGFLKARQG